MPFATELPIRFWSASRALIGHKQREDGTNNVCRGMLAS
jgi:hypothetical protein